MEIPIERTNAVIRILKRGSPKPPKKPTMSIRSVATATIAGITKISAPILPANAPAATRVSPIKTNIAIAIGCLHTSLI